MAMSKITNSISGRDGRDGREGPVGPRGLKGPKGFSLQMNSNLSFITKVLHELAPYIPVSTIQVTILSKAKENALKLENRNSYQNTFFFFSQIVNLTLLGYMCFTDILLKKKKGRLNQVFSFKVASFPHSLKNSS